jgi:hypothetical protein
MTAHTPLAAIRFEDGDIYSFLAQTVALMQPLGLRLRGVLQSRGAVGGDCHCAEMDLKTLGSNKTFRISQPLGNAARGCRLNPGALAECAAYLEAELPGANLLILNRFGKGESEGRGFRDLISAAVGQGIPVLTAIRPTYVQSWAAFGGDLACDLAMDQTTVMEWLSDMRRLQDAA